MLSPADAPTWNTPPANEPSNSFLPLNSLVLATRSISLINCDTSACMALRSLSLLVALDDCTASSRMRCSISPTLLKAPSAVCASEMPSLALRAATARPLDCAFMRSEIAKPAASSLALFTRRPEDRRCMEVARELPDRLKLRCELIDTTLVLMVIAIFYFPFKKTEMKVRCLCDKPWQLPWCCASTRDSRTSYFRAASAL